MRKGVLFVYDISDQRWADKLKLHIPSHQEDLHINIWDYYNLPAGAEVAVEKAKFFDTAKIVIVLLSPQFLGPDTHQEDINHLIKLAEQGAIKLFPIFIKPYDIEELPLSKFQPLNPSSHPLIDMDERKYYDFFVYVVSRIKMVLKNGIEEALSNTNDDSLKTEMVKNVELLNNSIVHDEDQYKNELEQALARICVFKILKNNSLKYNPNGLVIKDIQECSGIIKRKSIVDSLFEMERWGYITKTRFEKSTYWKLTEKGKEFAEEMDTSFEVLLERR